MDKNNIPKDDYTDIIYKLVKGSLGSIPLAGSVVAEIFGFILTEPITKRKTRWMELVVDKLNDLEERNNGLINGLRENDEFISFLLESSQIALKTHQEEKLTILKNVISNFIMETPEDYDKKYSFLKIIEEITPSHIEILNYIHINELEINENINGFPQLYEKYFKSQKIDKFYFRKCVFDLEKQSLIRINKDFNDYFDGTGYVSTDEGAPSIKILDIGKEFVQFIKEN